VADEARKAGKHVSAEVLKISTVLDLARKTGFLKVGTTELTHQIRRNP
jgi:ribosomal protein L7Ae-like RNA K-turn-binding protein